MSALGHSRFLALHSDVRFTPESRPPDRRDVGFVPLATIAPPSGAIRSPRRRGRAASAGVDAKRLGGFEIDH